MKLERQKLVRLADWEERFNRFLSQRLDAKHEEGEIDCALFAAEDIEALTGVDLGKHFRGKYSGKVGSARKLKELGVKDVRGLADALLPKVPVAMAQRGDIALVKGGNLAVVFGEVALGVGEDVVTGKQGLVRIPRADWQRAWAVG